MCFRALFYDRVQGPLYRNRLRGVEPIQWEHQPHAVWIALLSTYVVKLVRGEQLAANRPHLRVRVEKTSLLGMAFIVRREINGGKSGGVSLLGKSDQWIMTFS